MDEILKKAMRLEKPRYVSIQLRPEVYDWLRDMGLKVHCTAPVYARGLIEDYYDSHVIADPVQEVSGNE